MYGPTKLYKYVAYVFVRVYTFAPDESTYVDSAARWRRQLWPATMHTEVDLADMTIIMAS
jgi:hypothetical protein